MLVRDLGKLNHFVGLDSTQAILLNENKSVVLFVLVSTVDFPKSKKLSSCSSRSRSGLGPGNLLGVVLLEVGDRQVTTIDFEPLLLLFLEELDLLRVDIGDELERLEADGGEALGLMETVVVEEFEGGLFFFKRLD